MENIAMIPIPNNCFGKAVMLYCYKIRRGDYGTKDDPV